MDFFDLFEKIKEDCKSGVSEVAFKLWLSDIRAVSFDGKTAVLSVPTILKKNTIEAQYLESNLKKSFENVLGFVPEIDILVSEMSDIPVTEQSNETVFNANNGYTFNNFITGESNKFAFAASSAVAQNPSKAYNPLFIYGGVGLGKTHLLMAICNEIKKNHPDFKILYCKTEEFTNEIIDGIRNKDFSFRDKFRYLDVLAMDDIQFLAGKNASQEEFFNTYNQLHQDGKQILLASDRPPKDMRLLEERLRSRFESGLMADVGIPDFETRCAILKSKAEALGIDLGNDVIDFIAQQIKSNIRQLEGVVTRMKAYHEYTNSAFSIVLAQTVIRDITTEGLPIPMTIERIINETARTFDVDPEEIRSSSQSGKVSQARQVSIYAIKKITNLSTSDIGSEFSGRDHSTVVYALKQVEDKMKKDMTYKETVEDIITNVRNN